MTWNCYAWHSSFWNVFKNSSFFDSSLWDGTNVIIDVDGFDVGYYNMTLMVFHVSGHWFSSTAFVNVTDTVAPALTIPLVNHEIELGLSFTYDLNATDLSGVENWWLNTTDFDIVS